MPALPALLVAVSGLGEQLCYIRALLLLLGLNSTVAKHKLHRSAKSRHLIGALLLRQLVDAFAQKAVQMRVIDNEVGLVAAEHPNLLVGSSLIEVGPLRNRLPLHVSSRPSTRMFSKILR